MAVAQVLEKDCLAYAGALLRAVSHDVRAPDRGHLPGRLATLALLMDGIGREPA